jgi:penicillin-binding protein 1A
VRNDAPIRIGKWKPENYDGKYYGRVTLTTALAKSLNSVAAQLAREVGVGSVIEVAQRLGIESALAGNSSIALGTSEVTPLELTAAYVPFANGGFRPEVHFVNRVTDAGGTLLYARPPGKAPRVIGPEIVGMMNTMMTATISDGTGRKADFGWPAAGKTGTTQNSRDAWFVGYTAHLTTGVWFGNDDGRPMRKGATGGALPTVAWQAFMTAAHQGESVVPLPGDWRRTPHNADVEAPAIAVPLPESAEPRPPLPEFAQQPTPSTEPTDAAPTASIDHPVPPGNVGETRARGGSSILDIILGNGG